MRKQLNITAYQVRVSADGFKTFTTTIVREWDRAKRIAQRCKRKHRVEARILSVHSR